jgi:Tfp pilus assembly protein PilF
MRQNRRRVFFETQNMNKVYEYSLRAAVTIIGVVLLAIVAVHSAKIGISRLFTAAAVVQSVVEPADMAVQMCPTDPEAHYTRALELINSNRINEAVPELKTAVQLRPHHYYQWLDLGVTLDRIGDQAAAVAALQQSIQIAPHFAQPRWQLGNLLFRAGDYSNAFNEMRLAVQSDPNLTENMVRMATAAADGNVETMKQFIGSQNAAGRLQLAQFLASQGMAQAAVEQVREINPTNESENTLRQQVVVELLKSRSFAEAYDVWALNHSLPRDAVPPRDRLLNAAFVDPIRQNDPGFGWQSYQTAHVAVAIDPTGPASNQRSLRVQFNGDSPPAGWIISQTMLVEPNTEYSIEFAVRADKLVSGGLPVISVIDGSDSKLLGQSTPINGVADGWKSYKVSFSSTSHTPAVLVALHRMPCAENACPAFGTIWLSGFAVAK